MRPEPAAGRAAPAIAIRDAVARDRDAMWRIFRRVAARGDALPFDETFPREAFRAHWSGPQAVCVAVAADGAVAGMYRLGANHAGRGAHVASATYLVDPDLQGRGIGGALLAHSLDRARAAGFAAIQFNFVVSSNEAALSLYRRHGFEVVGILPRAFRHARLGPVDAYVMFLALDADRPPIDGA